MVRDWQVDEIDKVFDATKLPNSPLSDGVRPQWECECHLLYLTPLARDLCRDRKHIPLGPRK